MQISEAIHGESLTEYFKKAGMGSQCSYWQMKTCAEIAEFNLLKDWEYKGIDKKENDNGSSN